MSKTPFMPLWNGDFLAATLELDATEIGAYILLIMAQWHRKGRSLPSDEKRLQRVARCGRSWPKVWANISRFFDVDEDGVYNATCRELFQNAAAKSQVNAQNGARGGFAKSLKSKNGGLANATRTPQRKSAISESDSEREEREPIGSPKKLGQQQPNILNQIRVACGAADTVAWSGKAAAETVTIWMALGLTPDEILEAAAAWDGRSGPLEPRELDALMNGAAAEKRGPKAKRKKDTPLPEDWFLPKSWGQWAFNEGMPIMEIRRQADMFKDYWHSIANTKRGMKSQWEPTWRNWIRKHLSETSKGTRNGTAVAAPLPPGGQRIDPAIAQIARLTGLAEPQGDGGDGIGGDGPEDGGLWLGDKP